MMGSISQDELLANLIGEDATKTKANVEAFTKLFNEAVNEIVKKKAQQEFPAGRRQVRDRAAEARQNLSRNGSKSKNYQIG